MDREPAVAGVFYPAAPAAVAAEIARLVVSDARAAPAVAVVSPHAGWRYRARWRASCSPASRATARAGDRAQPHGPRTACQRLAGRRVAPARGWSVRGADRRGFVAALWPRRRCCAPTARRTKKSTRSRCCCRCSRRASRTAAGAGGAGRAWSFSRVRDAGAGDRGRRAAAADPTMIVASSDMSHYLADDEARAVDRLALAPLAAADPRASTTPCAPRHQHVRRHPGDGRAHRGARAGPRAPASSATPPAPTPAATTTASSATPPSESTRDESDDMNNAVLPETIGPLPPFFPLPAKRGEAGKGPRLLAVSPHPPAFGEQASGLRRGGRACYACCSRRLL